MTPAQLQAALAALATQLTKVKTEYDASIRIPVQVLDISGTAIPVTTTQYQPVRILRRSIVVDTTAPSAPTWATVVFSNVISTSQKIDWNDNPEIDLREYQVWSNTASGSYSLIATVQTSSYTHTGLSPLTLYGYKIKAVDTSNNVSVFSSEQTNTTAASGVTLLLTESFEDANLSARGWFDGPTTTITTSQVIPGSLGALDFTWTAGQIYPANGDIKRKLFAASDSVYFSCYMKVSSNWAGSGVTYHPHLFYLLTNLDDAWIGPSATHMTFYAEPFDADGKLRFTFQDALNINSSGIGSNLIGVTENRGTGGCNGTNDGVTGQCYLSGSQYINGKEYTTTTGYINNTYRKLEVFVQLNSILSGIGQADGVINAWVDEVLVMNRTNVILRTGANPTMKFTEFVLGPYIGVGSPVTQSIWIDDLVVATGRITTPAVPTGLAIGSATSSSLTASWNPVAGASSYTLYRSPNGSSNWTTTSGLTGTSTVVTGLVASSTYYFSVVAVNSSGYASRFPANASGSTSAISAAGTLLTHATWENGVVNQSGWTSSTSGGGTLTVSTDTTQNYNGSAGSLRGVYPTNSSGGIYVDALYTVPANTTNLYFDLWAKMPSALKRGNKFVKVFGLPGAPGPYANTTFNGVYGSGTWAMVSFGDGSGTSNDTNMVVRFDGTTSAADIGRSAPSSIIKTAAVLAGPYPNGAVISTPMNANFSNWGTGWHHFRLAVGFNSGTTAANEVNDGFFYVEIDGNIYCDARGLFNRHYSNLAIDRFELFGWTQTTGPFEYWYDEVYVSTNGWFI